MHTDRPGHSHCQSAFSVLNGGRVQSGSSLTVVATVCSLATGISEQQLQLKERLCREVLQLLQTLGAGQCRMRGQNECDSCLSVRGTCKPWLLLDVIIRGLDIQCEMPMSRTYCEVTTYSFWFQRCDTLFCLQACFFTNCTVR
jgi:hypothetical protein